MISFSLKESLRTTKSVPKHKSNSSDIRQTSPRSQELEQAKKPVQKNGPVFCRIINTFLLS